MDIEKMKEDMLKMNKDAYVQGSNDSISALLEALKSLNFESISKVDLIEVISGFAAKVIDNEKSD